MPFSPPHDSKPIAFRISILPGHRGPQTQRDTATRSLPQTDRLPNPQTCRPRKAPAAGKIPFPPPRVGSVHASASFLSVPPPAPAPAFAPSRILPSTRASVVPSAESAAPPASPWFPHSTPRIDPVVVVGFLPLATDDRPPPAVDRTPETTGTHCSAPPALDKFPCPRPHRPPSAIAFAHAANTPHTPSLDIFSPRTPRLLALPPNLPPASLEFA